MTPKDKGMLRELLHEYGASVLIQMLAKESHGQVAGKFLRAFLQAVGEELEADEQDCGDEIRGPSDSEYRKVIWIKTGEAEYGAPDGDPEDADRCRA